MQYVSNISTFLCSPDGFAVWAAFVSTINASGVSDLIITLISLGSFVLGFGLGVFEVGYYAGMTLIALLGGFSVGVRIVLFRADLLIHKFFANWLVIVGLGLLMFLLMLVQQRATMARRLVHINETLTHRITAFF